MKVEKLSRKEYKKRFGTTDAFCERYRGTEPVIYLPGRGSTKEILHEIYHATRSPELKEIEEGKVWQTPEETALEEIRAQAFAAETIGKEGILGNQLKGVIQIMIDIGCRPNTVLSSIVKALREEGYEVDDDYKSLLWEAIKDRYEEKKKGVL